MRRGLKIASRILLSLVGFVLLLMIAAVVLIRIPSVQTRVAQYFTTRLSQRLNAEVSIGSVDIRFFKTIKLNNFLVRDQHRDTVLAAGELYASVKIVSVLNNVYDIQKIELDNAFFNCVKPSGDTAFNFQFIVNALSSPASKDTSKLNLKLSLRQVTLHNARFRWRDVPSGLDVAIRLDGLDGGLKKFIAQQPYFDFDKLVLNRPDVRVAVMPEEVHDSISVVDTGIVHLDTKPFAAFADAFEMRDAFFSYDHTASPYDTTMFDPSHFTVSAINLFARRAAFAGDTIAADVDNFSVHGGCGFQLDSLAGHARVNPKTASLTNMVLKLPHSRLANAVTFTYHDFSSFEDFITAVRMHADFKNSVMDLRDLACFAPPLLNFGQPIYLNGTARGTVNDLKATNITLRSGTNTYLHGNVSLVGLPNLDETYVDFNTDAARTDYNDLKKIYTQVELPVLLRELGTINFKGNFTGFTNDFVAFGDFQTALGNLQSDLNMKIHSNDLTRASYSGKLSATNFDLGKLAGTSVLGKSTFYARVSGIGLTLGSVNASVISAVQSLELNGYAYRNANVNGLFDKKLFTGKLTAFDPNIRLDFQGTVDFNDKLPRYNFYARVDSAKLKTLGFSNDDYLFSTSVNLDLVGNNADNLVGSALARDVMFQRSGKKFSLDSLLLNISAQGNDKRITLRSDMASADVNGAVDWIGLPDALVATARRYYPSLPIHYTTRNFGSQRFNYNVRVNNADRFFNFFYPDVQALHDAVISGSFNGGTQDVQTTGNVGKLSVKNYTANRLSIGIHTNNDRLALQFGADELYVNDSTRIVKPSVGADVANNVANVTIKARGENDSTHINMNAVVTGETDSTRVQLKTSDVVLHGQRWQVNDSNLVVFGKNSLRINDLLLYTSNQSVAVTSLHENGNDDVLVTFSNLDLGVLYRYVRIGAYNASGIVNGTAKLINPFTGLRFESDATITNFVFNGDSIKKITAVAGYDPQTDKINLSLKAKDFKYDFEANGTYDPNAADALDVKVEVLKFRLPVLDKYLGEYVSSVEGYTGGTLHLHGTPLKPLLNGSLVISNCNARVNYLQTSYRFDNATITFNDNFIDLGEITIYDVPYHNAATLGGEIFHDHLSHFTLNVYVNTNRLLVLNTTLRDNNLYYGTAFAGGLVTFKGPLDNLEINADMQSKQGTKINIPISDQYNVSEHHNIRFVNTGSVQTKSVVKAAASNYLLTVNMNLDITQDALVKIIFDQKAGDIISGRGNGNLRLEINTDGVFNMYGDYTIAQGDYLFTLQNFINKRFEIGNGGSISWSGDPYKAQVNIEAIYSVKNASLNDLASTNATDAELDAQRQIPVDVYMILTGSLLQPAIAFDLRLPGSAGSVGSTATRELDRIRQDENELNKQVFGLLILNRFIPSNVDAGIVSSGVNTSVSEFLFNQLSYWASQNALGIGVNVNYNAYSVAGSEQEQQVRRRELIVGLEKSFFNERLTVEAGGNFGLGGANSSDTPNPTNPQGNRVTPDINVRYKLSKDGRYTLNAYNKSQYDEILDANRNKRGVSLSYQKEFNSFKELFRKRDKTKSGAKDVPEAAQ